MSLTRFPMLRGIYQKDGVHYGTSTATDTETGERLQHAHIDIDLSDDKGMKLARWLDLQGFISYKPNEVGQPITLPAEEEEIVVEDLLKKKVDEIATFVSGVNNLEDLQEIRAVEIAGTNRTTVVKALDAQITKVSAGA